MKYLLKKKWNEVVIFEIVFGMGHGQPYEGFQTIPDSIQVACNSFNIFFHSNGT
jgi:hypothetical protein